MIGYATSLFDVMNSLPFTFDKSSSSSCLSKELLRLHKGQKTKKENIFLHRKKDFMRVEKSVVNAERDSFTPQYQGGSVLLCLAPAFPLRNS